MRRRSFVIAGTLVAVLIGGFFLYRTVFKERHSSLILFHWIPGPQALKVLSMPPFADRENADVEKLIDPRLVATLREASVTGELRVVGMMYFDNESNGTNGGILLQNAPQGPFIVRLVDSETVVYSDQTVGFSAFPKNAPPLAATLTFSPGKNAQMSLLHITLTNPNGSDPWGVVAFRWW